MSSNLIFIYLFVFKLISIKCLTIPDLPEDHYKYWIGSNGKQNKLLNKFCENQNYSEITIESKFLFKQKIDG